MRAARFLPQSFLVCVFFLLLAGDGAGQTPSYKYFRIGRQADATTSPSAGSALMGGGNDLDEAFGWLCGKANGGDFLILRARGDDDYNPYVNGLCKLNSVATLIIPDRSAALEPRVAEIIRQAEAVFVAGGDQALYVRFWQGTPVQDAINADVAAGKPVGGTSAGLAILGEFAYGALGDKPDDEDLASAKVLVNPFDPRVTVLRDFLRVPYLQNTITDSHFAKRNRMGRTLVFLARLMEDGWSNHPRDIAIDERSAVLVEPDGKATVVGTGKGAYFIQPAHAPEVCRANTALRFRGLAVYHAGAGGEFDLQSWSGTGGNSYEISVENGAIKTTQPRDAVY
jgi:cyanophycinase